MLTELEMRADAEARHAHRELVEKLQPNDGRPCATDVFLAEVVYYEEWQLRRALEAWVEGAWDEAIEGTTIAEMKGETNG